MVFIQHLMMIILSVGYLRCDIQWNGKNWAHNCDFRGSDLSNALVPAKECGGKCAATFECTHFTWTNYNGGTCWLKKGAVSKSDAFESYDGDKVCGVTENNSLGGGDIINEQNFACVFNTIDAATRQSRLEGLKASGWKPVNKDEAAVFLAHVYHETDGLKTIREYCAPGCAHEYAGTWCSIHGKPDKLYYGRGWFQLSWPCNYHQAGQMLGVDLLSNPDLVEQDQGLAVRTAVWFYESQGMSAPAQKGDFASTTRIINGKLECDGNSFSNQIVRVETYRRVRKCFDLGEPAIDPICYRRRSTRRWVLRAIEGLLHKLK